jgi:hypothetical protein
MKTNKIDMLKQQRKQLDARIQKLAAAESNRERKRDTRRKILVGSFYLDYVEKNNRQDELKKKLDGFLTRNTDRALFDLPSLEKEAKETTLAPGDER